MKQVIKYMIGNKKFDNEQDVLNYATAYALTYGCPPDIEEVIELQPEDEVAPDGYLLN